MAAGNARSAGKTDARGQAMAQTPLADARQVQAKLVSALCDPARYPHPATPVEHIETHISHVLLAGDYAYKIKKPVNLGFLDFTTLAARRFYCEEELRLNRRLAPKLYLEVVPIGGSAQAPVLAAASGIIEYALKMQRFPQEALFDRLASRGELTGGHIDALAGVIADFHGRVERARVTDPYGAAPAVGEPMRQNFAQLRQLTPLLATDSERGMLAAIENWSLRRHAELVPVFEERHAEGFVRECHGDLHLGNVAWVDGTALPFDCIEFNPNLRWIDVMSEVAFLIMDLCSRGLEDLANRFVNAYLETSGDYAGLLVLDNYLVYRAMVRAKVAAIRASQPDASDALRCAATADYRAHLALAERFTKPRRRTLVIMHGLSGSGKTVISQGYCEATGAVRLRSDVERKRMAGLERDEESGSGIASGIYDEGTTLATYAELTRLARLVLEAGWPAVVDAAFLRRWQRETFSGLAGEFKVPFLVVACGASEAVLRERVTRRAASGHDASEADLAVLNHQIAGAEPFAAEEKRLAVDTGEEPTVQSVVRIVAALAEVQP